MATRLVVVIRVDDRGKKPVAVEFQGADLVRCDNSNAHVADALENALDLVGIESAPTRRPKAMLSSKTVENRIESIQPRAVRERRHIV